MSKSGRVLFAVMALLFCVHAVELSAASGAGSGSGAPYIIDHWDTEDGLPQNSVIAIAQTRDGYLWLGTLNGLVRFDGHHFDVFDESNTPGLNSGRIVYLFEDSEGTLWIGTHSGGVAHLKNGEITSPRELAFSGAEKRLRSACEDTNHAIWLYSDNGDLWRFSHGSPRPFLQSNYRQSRCRSMIAEPSGPVWVGTDRHQSAIGPIVDETSVELPVIPNLDLEVTNRLDLLLASREQGYWRLANGQIQKWTTNHLVADWGAYPWSADIRVSAACEDRQGNLLVGTLGAGVFWFDGQGHFTCISTNGGLSQNYVLSLEVDREDTLWVGTDGGGLNRVKRKVFDVLPETRGLVVTSVSEDSSGKLWMGFNDIASQANGAASWKDGVLEWFGPAQGLANSSVLSIFADRQTNVWAGNLFVLLNGNPKFQQVARAGIIAIHQDRTNRLWFGTFNGLLALDSAGWKAFTANDGLSGTEVRAIADDHEGNLWIGTVRGGLNRLRDGKFIAYHKRDGLPSEDISSLYVDDQDVLWIGTFGSGLARLEHGQWSHYTAREGLISSSIGYLLEDGQGYLWIGSNRGLMRVPKKALNDFAHGVSTFIPFQAYRKADGLPTSECTSGSQPGACRTRDGKLWFPTIKGLASIDPAQLHSNTNPPPVVIESVLIDGQPQSTNALRVNWPQLITIPAGKERLEIHYASLNLAAPERARFKHRLEGHETGWTDAGNDRVARYYKLPAGHYRFQVTACNEDGVWNSTGSTLALAIEPPFWRTWWFLTVTVASVLGTTVGMVHYLSTQKLQRQVERLRQQDALEKERARIARDIHDQLGASLTQVSLLGEFVESDKDSPAEVEAHARQICQTARETTRVLDEIVWTVNPSNDTLDGLITYICKYAQDYLSVAGLRYRLEVPPDLPGAPIPPEFRHNVFLAAKEAITNIVRHSKASAAWLRLKLEPAAFTLEIEDNGAGLGGLDKKAAQSRSGLRNMRKRMEDIHGTFTMTDGAEGGTLVRLTAPLGVPAPGAFKKTG